MPRMFQGEVSLASTVRSPQSQFEVAVHDKRFPTNSFDRQEAELFEQQFNDLIADLDSSVLKGVLMERAETIANVAAFAKHDLEAKNFGGINAGDNEIGFSLLRPGHIYSDSSGTIQNDWFFQPGTTGWTDWIGDGTSGNNKTVNEDEVLLVLGLIDQEDAQSVISGINVDQFGRNMDMLPQDLNDMRLMDSDTGLQYESLPTLIGQENDEIHIRLRADRDVERQPRLLGFTFGLGTRLNTEDY